MVASTSIKRSIVGGSMMSHSKMSISGRLDGKEVMQIEDNYMDGNELPQEDAELNCRRPRQS